MHSEQAIFRGVELEMEIKNRFKYYSDQVENTEAENRLLTTELEVAKQRLDSLELQAIEIEMAIAQNDKNFFINADFIFEIEKRIEQLSEKGIKENLSRILKARGYSQASIDLAINKVRGKNEKQPEELIKLADYYINFGIACLSKDQASKALQFFNDAIKIQEQLNQEVALAESYSHISKAYFLQDQREEVKKWLKKTVALKKKLGLEVDQAIAYHNLAYLYFEGSQPDSAFFYAQESIQLSEKHAQQDKEEWAIQGLNPNIPRAAEIAIASAIKIRKPEAVFHNMEYLKIQKFKKSFLDSDFEKANLPKGIQLEKKILQQQLKKIHLQIKKQIPSQRRKHLLKTRDSLYQRRVVMEDFLNSSAPGYAKLAYMKPATFSDLRKILNEEEVVIQYLLGWEIAYVSVVTKEKVVSIELKNLDKIRSLTRQFRKIFLCRQKMAISRGDILANEKLKREFHRISHELYNLIWAPIRLSDFTNNKKLIIVSDNELQSFPFEMLITDEHRKSYKKYDYLIKSYEITYYPSNKLLIEQRNKDYSRPFSSAFFGIGVTDFGRIACDTNRLSLQKLPNVIPEIEGILHSFRSAPHYFLLGENASEENLKKMNLEDFRFIHFSTHTVMNSTNPAYSYLMLLPSEQEDGCLNLHEFNNLNLKADLITFSACGPGLTKLIPGNGFLDFAESLMHKGNQSIVLSLWEVADQSTKKLFTNYYSILALNNNTNKYHPLRQNQLKMIESGGAFANPYFWAPFQFIGESYSEY